LLHPQANRRDAGASFFPNYLVEKLTLWSPSIVEFATQDESKTAIANLSESQLLGRPIFIREVCRPFHPLSHSTKGVTELTRTIGPRGRVPLWPDTRPRQNRCRHGRKRHIRPSPTSDVPWRPAVQGAHYHRVSAEHGHEPRESTLCRECESSLSTPSHSLLSRREFEGVTDASHIHSCPTRPVGRTSRTSSAMRVPSSARTSMSASMDAPKEVGRSCLRRPRMHRMPSVRLPPIHYTFVNRCDADEQR